MIKEKVKMKFQEATFFAPAKATAARNLTGIYFLTKGTVKTSNFFATAKALVARNLTGIYFLPKGTIR